jgi:hypothetical protein
VHVKQLADDAPELSAPQLRVLRGLLFSNAATTGPDKPVAAIDSGDPGSRVRDGA